jgi:hypothetical protein
MNWYVKFYICATVLVLNLFFGSAALAIIEDMYGLWVVPAGIVWVLGSFALMIHVFTPWLDND